MTKYFLHDGNQEQGPFDIEQLKSKNLRNDTKIWHDGLDSWTTVGQLVELKHLVISTPPPLTKPVEEIKSTPPKMEQAQYAYSNQNSNTYNEPIPEKKKSKPLPLIIAGLLIVGSVIGWLVYQNTQNKEIIAEVNDKVETANNAKDQNEERRKEINKANTIKNMNFRNNWQNYIKVDHSEPKVNYTLGGISSFDVYVSNETTYMLDQVDIYVEYIRKNGETYQTKTVTILNVPAGSTETGLAPESVNGVKVNCTISKIVSKKMHFCYPADNGNPEDPYFCK
jgi:hypothetical protein